MGLDWSDECVEWPDSGPSPIKLTTLEFVLRQTIRVVGGSEWNRDDMFRAAAAVAAAGFEVYWSAGGDPSPLGRLVRAEWGEEVVMGEIVRTAVLVTDRGRRLACGGRLGPDERYHVPHECKSDSALATLAAAAAKVEVPPWESSGRVWRTLRPGGDVEHAEQSLAALARHYLPHALRLGTHSGLCSRGPQLFFLVPRERQEQRKSDLVRVVIHVAFGGITSADFPEVAEALAVCAEAQERRRRTATTELSA